ncbi:hypothetical protein B0J15DRAFT_409337, partial [Fusarium solani]
TGFTGFMHASKHTLKLAKPAVPYLARPRAHAFWLLSASFFAALTPKPPPDQHQMPSPRWTQATLLIQPPNSVPWMRRFSAKGQNREPQELSCAAVKAKSEKLTPRSARILWLLLVVGARPWPWVDSWGPPSRGRVWVPPPAVARRAGTWSATPYGTRNRYPSQKNQGQAILG